MKRQKQRLFFTFDNIIRCWREHSLINFLAPQLVFSLPLLLVFIGVELLDRSTPESLAYFFENFRSNHEILTDVMRFCSFWVSKWFYLFYAILLYKAVIKKDVTGKRLIFSLVLIHYICISILLQIIKISIGVPRPYTHQTEWQPFSLSTKYHSFPSGHVTEITGAVGVTAFRSKRTFIILLWGFIPAIVAFSRIYLNAHHPSDILAGFIFGSFSTWLALYFWKKDISLRWLNFIESKIYLLKNKFLSNKQK